MLNKVGLHGLGLAALVAMLVGCGAEREEPFDPGEPEEVRTSVTATLHHDDQTENQVDGLPILDPRVSSRRVEVIRDQEDFEELINAYTFTDVTVNTPDFEEGQVVLYDSGWFDNSACALQLTLRNLQAYHITEDESIGEAVLRYDLSEAEDDATCTEELPLRRWEFHYVETRAHLLVVEEVRGLNEGSSANTSSASSAASSSMADF